MATISVSAGTLVTGAQAVNYGASSGTFVGAAGEEKAHLFYDDPRLAGGTRTLGVTDSVVESVAGNGRVAFPTC